MHVELSRLRLTRRYRREVDVTFPYLRMQKGLSPHFVRAKLTWPDVTSGGLPSPKSSLANRTSATSSPSDFDTTL